MICDMYFEACVWQYGIYVIGLDWFGLNWFELDWIGLYEIWTFTDVEVRSPPGTQKVPQKYSLKSGKPKAIYTTVPKRKIPKARRTTPVP